MPVKCHSYGEFEENYHKKMLIDWETEDLYNLDDKYYSMGEKITDSNKIREIVKEEIIKLLSHETIAINNNDLIRRLSPINKNPKSFEKLLTLCKTKPKNFASHKEYLKFIDEG